MKIYKFRIDKVKNYFQICRLCGSRAHSTKNCLYYVKI